MQLHELTPKTKPKKKKRVGRGGKRGTYSGRGVKGQTSRTGFRKQPIIRELIKKYPKLRGYRWKSQIQNPKSKIVVVNLEILEKNFASGEKITPEILLEKKLIRKIRGRVPEIKILSKGEIKKRLVIEGCQVSKGAKEKVEKAGGIINTD